MKTKYTSDEILKMAVGFIKEDLDADIDKDGKITSDDARLKKRVEDGTDKGNTDTLTASDILDRIIENTDSFSYDFNVDPLYQQYSRLYSDAASRDSQDIYGLAASLTGGYGNSYGLTRAAEIKSEYADKLSEKAGELESRAYEKYLDSKKDYYDIFEALRKLEEDKSKEESDAFDKALELAGLGDFSALKSLGADTSALESKNSRQLAEFFAKYKDYSLLKDIGVNTEALEKEELYELAKLFASYGDYSALKALGIDTSAIEEDAELERLIKSAKLK